MKLKIKASSIFVTIAIVVLLYSFIKGFRYYEFSDKTVFSTFKIIENGYIIISFLMLAIFFEIKRLADIHDKNNEEQLENRKE